MTPKTDTPEAARQRDESYRKSSQDHVRRYLATDGKDGYIRPGSNIPNLILTTIGRRSGKPYATPLYFGEENGRYFVVASYAGSDTHPKWYLNLREHPNVEVQIRGERFAARARTATPGEKPRLWALMTKVYPRYDDFQRATEREIPVVILEPT
jgi:deazaflavin-dependent oxidoreductase (nitroreductase family)